MTFSVDIPRVHMAGSHAHHQAHLEIGRHGIALFLTADAEFPVLDVNATWEQLEEIARDLQAGIAAAKADQPDAAAAIQMTLLPSTAERTLRP